MQFTLVYKTNFLWTFLYNLVTSFYVEEIFNYQCPLVNRLMMGCMELMTAAMKSLES